MVNRSANLRAPRTERFLRWLFCRRKYALMPHNKSLAFNHPHVTDSAAHFHVSGIPETWKFAR